jgi:hypothetical protein
MKKNEFKVVNEGTDTDKEIVKPFCCDLLSIAMSKAPAGAAWVTVMGNINTLAVASLTDCAVVILAESAALDETAIAKAKSEGITILATDEPIYETASRIGKAIE